MRISTHGMALLALSMMSAPAFASSWGYEGEEAPGHWAEIDEAYKTCQTGMNQSPVNIDSTIKGLVTPLITHYTDGPVTLLNNGHTIEAQMKDGTHNSIVLDEVPFVLQQFHFHSPAENTIHGKQYPLEMHLVHTNAKGEIAVIAVMFDTGAANPELDLLWRNVPDQPEQSILLMPDLNINRLLPVNKAYWRFSGSLTTPPCSEGVIWLVLKEPLTFSAAQLKKFTHAIFYANNRPVQPLHGRVVVE